MRRRTRFGLVALALLVALFGLYAAAWRVLAGRLEDGFVASAQSARADNVDLSWQAIGVGGFPLALRVELADAHLVDRAVEPALDVKIPLLSAAAAPWNFRVWRLAAPRGIAAELAGDGARPPVAIDAAAAEATVSADAAGGATLWLRLRDAGFGVDPRVLTHLADAWVMLPATPPHADTDPAVAAAFDLHGVRLPAAISRFGDTVDELAAGVTVKGAMPGGALKRAVAAWRDAGGTIELDNLRLQWGAFEANAKGTLALDQELQPIGAFSGAVEGWDEIIGALVRSGALPARNAGLTRLALTLMAKTGPDGRPRIATSFRIQNGEMFLGPARLGKAPRIAWN